MKLKYSSSEKVNLKLDLNVTKEYSEFPSHFHFYSILGVCPTLDINAACDHFEKLGYDVINVAQLVAEKSRYKGVYSNRVKRIKLAYDILSMKKPNSIVVSTIISPDFIQTLIGPNRFFDTGSPKDGGIYVWDVNEVEFEEHCFDLMSKYAESYSGQELVKKVRQDAKLARTFSEAYHYGSDYHGTRFAYSTHRFLHEELELHPWSDDFTSPDLHI
uniref:Uncharacterized protein n=1 Tax=viral metagenome TaxID=1070528 RepID=A0A2V0RA43_9ZZZZ